MEDAQLLNSTDNEGRTALHLAMASADDRVVKALLSHKDTAATKQVKPTPHPRLWTAWRSLCL